MAKMRKGDMPYRHSQSHKSDSSGAHARATHHHMKNHANATDGLTPNEGGSATPSGPGDNDADDMMEGGMPPGGSAGGMGGMGGAPAM